MRSTSTLRDAQAVDLVPLILTPKHVVEKYFTKELTSYIVVRGMAYKDVSLHHKMSGGRE